MSTRRRKTLPEDDSGVRPGHPMPGLDRLTCAEVAAEEWLHTTPQTVRTLIERGDLDGYWERVGMIYRFWAYRSAVERFITSYGRYPDARRRLTTERKSASAGRPAQSSPSGDSETTRLNLRILGLQETVRCQSAVIEKLRKVTIEQQAVASHLRQAERASARAVELLNDANEEYHRLVSLEGMPDDPSGAATN